MSTNFNRKFVFHLNFGLKLITVLLIFNNSVISAENIAKDVINTNKTEKSGNDLSLLMDSHRKDENITGFPVIPDQIIVSEDNYFEENLNTILFLGIVLSIICVLIFIRYKARRKEDFPITDDSQLSGRTVIDTTGFQDVPLHSSQSLPSLSNQTYVYSTQSSNVNNYWPTTASRLQSVSKDNCVELPPSYETVTTIK